MYQQNRKKAKKIKYKFSVVFFLSLLVFVISFGLYMMNTTLDELYIDDGSDDPTTTVPNGPDSMSTTTPTTPPTTTTKPNDDSSGNPDKITNPVPECAPFDFGYFDDCVFVGDSLSYGLASYNILNPYNVYASIGMSISNINNREVTTEFGELTVIEGLKKKQPKNIYIMLGSNGIAWLTSKNMIEKYSTFIDEVKENCPFSKIYILTIPPVTAAKEVSSDSPISNKDINEYNADLLELANEKEVFLVDLHAALKNDEGVLSEDMAARDGMHFTRATYDIMLDVILRHVAR